MVLETFVIFGLGREHPHSFERHQWIVKPYGADKYVAIGSDPGDRTFLLHESGNVYSVGTDPPPDAPEYLCPSFTTLVDEIFCGPKFSEYFGGRRQDSDWYLFLRSQGWA
jgi:hypothetical protein